MLRNSRSSYLLSSNFQKKQSEDSRRSSKLSNSSTKDHLKIDNLVKECQKDDVLLFFNKLLESPSQ